MLTSHPHRPGFDETQSGSLISPLRSLTSPPDTESYFKAEGKTSISICHDFMSRRRNQFAYINKNGEESWTRRSASKQLSIHNEIPIEINWAMPANRASHKIGKFINKSSRERWMQLKMLWLRDCLRKPLIIIAMALESIKRSYRNRISLWAHLKIVCPKHPRFLIIFRRFI